MTINVASLHIYPLKSGAGIDVPRLDITPRGPRHDRLWMVVKDDNDMPGRFLTQRDRNCEKLALISPVLCDDGKSLSFAAPGMTTLPDKAIELSSGVYDTKVFASPVKVRDAGEDAAAWISDYLGQDARLVRLSDGHRRAVDPEYGEDHDQTSLADGFPLLVASKPSLASLSAHFPPNTDIGMDRFRANIVLDGNLPFEEDVLHVVRIGEVVLELVKPCTRCKIPTINQQTAIADSMEPLTTLTRVRRGKGDGLQGVFFGQDAIPRSLGEISVGDRVEVLLRQRMHAALENAALKYAL
jgi:uncharacterized protein YcbX